MVQKYQMNQMGSSSSKLDKLLSSFPEMERTLTNVGITRLRLWRRFKIEIFQYGLKIKKPFGMEGLEFKITINDS